MQAPSICAWHVEQFFVPLDLGHTCYGSISQMTSWLNCSQNILHPKVQVSSFSLTKFSKIWPTMNSFPTSLPPSWSNAPCPFVDKGHQTIPTSLWLNLKFCIQTIPKTFRKSEARCIARNHSIMPKTYAPWPAYTSLGQFLACSQKHCQYMPLCVP